MKFLQMHSLKILLKTFYKNNFQIIKIIINFQCQINRLLIKTTFFSLSELNLYFTFLIHNCLELRYRIQSRLCHSIQCKSILNKIKFNSFQLSGRRMLWIICLDMTWWRCHSLSPYLWGLLPREQKKLIILETDFISLLYCKELHRPNDRPTE